MVSPLSPQQFVPTQNFGEQLLGAVAQGQGIQQNRQALQMNDQAMQMRGQNQQQQISEYDYMTGVRRLEVINRLAKHARTLQTPQEREQFKQSIDPSVLESVGIDPAQLAQTPVDDRGLDSLIAQTQAALPQKDQMQIRVQSSQVLDNGTTVQVLTDGSTRVTDPNGRVVEGDKRAQAIRDAQQFGVDLQSQRAGGRTSATIDARVEGGGKAQFVENLEAGRGKNKADSEAVAGKADKISNNLLANIEQARNILPQATGSGAGALVDSLGRAVGVTSESAKAAAKLETLAGWMVANVPRMEGPQSNIDVENYKTMAARVGNREIPVEERLAALDTLEMLQKKYSENNRKAMNNPATTDETQSIEELLRMY